MTPPANTADDRTKRAFTPARIVGLVLVALVAGTLAYVRLAAGADTMSVPKGAQAGDLALHECEYATENGSYPADCGTLVVRENRADPKSRLISLPVTRIHARSAHPAEPIFRLEGGPGITNMEFSKASRYADDHDVVLVGYRGVDGSVRLDCPEVDSALSHSTDFLGEKSFRAYVDGFRACADRLTDEGVYLGGYGLPQQVDDLEAARRALGYDRIDLLSESAGTRTALIYGWRYPKSIHRSVLIGANPPGHFLWDARTTDEQIARYSALCSEDATCSERTDDLAATMRGTGRHIPDRWLFLPIDEASVRIFSFYGLMETTSEMGPLSGPMTIDAWLSASEGDPSGFWLQSLFGDLFPMPFVWGQYAAAARIDARAADDYFSDRGSESYSNLGRAASAFAWGGGGMVDGWPAAPDENAYDRMRTSNVETLVVGGSLDFSTPPQLARTELLPYLPNGRQVVLPGFGHSLSFWTQQPEAGTKLVTTFLETGKVDASAYEPQSVDFTPAVGFATIAKVVAGAMAALALLTVGLLLWMPRRVHWQGRFGRKTSAVLRSLVPVVLGVGGWCLGVLVSTTAMPSIPLDDELFASLSVGLPIGLGVYFAWVDRDWSASTKATGFAAATAGALVGAWLGLTTTEGLAALVTTVAGAIAGANLVLLALDVAWDRRAHDRFAETGQKATLDASPSTP